MNHFVERLPWRIAALAGLLVGGISLWTGADPWTSLLRVSAAFVIFGGAGWALRLLLQSEAAAPPIVPGRLFDQTTPEDNTEEHTPPTSSNAGDAH